MRIELDKISKRPGAQAHGFPFQIAMQTQEFIQATIFHHAFMDVSAGQRVREPGGFAAVEAELLKSGLDSTVNKQAWSLIEKYQGVFERFISQNVLILMRSHWDWYVEKIGAFVLHGRNELGGPPISSRQAKDLDKIGFLSIRKQIEILAVSTELNFQLEEAVMRDAEEMSFVRNLGVHNRWEVNEFYLSKTSSKPTWSLGEIRVFSIDELQQWHQTLERMIRITSVEIAKLFKDASDFDHLLADDKSIK